MQSANIPIGPRNPNGYTEEEVMRALRGIDGSRYLSFRYELLDQNNVKIRDMDEILGGSIEQNFLGVIKRTANFTLKDQGKSGINYLTDQIKVFCRLRMPARKVPAQTLMEVSWSNDFNGISEEPVTLESAASQGDPLADTDNCTYDSSANFGGGTSVYAAPEGYIQSIQTYPDRMDRKFSCYFFVPENGDFTVDFFDGSGDAFSDFRVVVDDQASVFTVYNGSEDISEYADELVGQWVRLEMVAYESRNRVDYKFSWGDLNGTPQSFVVEVEPSFSPVPYSFIAGSSNPSSQGCWMDKLSFGGANFVPERPVESDNDFVEWPLGVFLLSSPTQASDEDDVIIREITGYDRSKIFVDSRLSERYTILKGESYIDHINTLLGDVPKKVTPISTVAGKDREWPPGTEVENIINDITQSINYESLTFDEDGFAVIRPYILPEERSPEFHYTDDDISIMHPNVVKELDLFDIANRWVIVVSNEEQEPITVSLENNDPSNPTSIPRRGRVITDFREDEQATDYGTLMRRIRRIAFEASRVFEGIEFDTAINPLHSFNDMYTIQYEPLGINEKYTEHTWSFPLEAGGTMSHRARRVVKLNAEDDQSYIDGDLEITGALWADNFAFGTVNVTPPATGINSVVVDGFHVKGSGAIYVFLTNTAPISTSPSPTESRLQEMAVMDETPTSFKIYYFATSTAARTSNWFVYTDV